MTDIFLTRHGHVEGIVPARFRGREDIPLTDQGREQAEQLGTLIASLGRVDAIYTSPLSRAIHTGSAVQRATGVKSTPLSQLVDIDYGEWTGRTHSEVERADPVRYARWRTQPHLAPPPGGESLQELVARAAAGLHLILNQHPNGTVLLVGHDSTNRALLLTMLDLSPSAFWLFDQAPCNLTRIEINPHGVRIHSMNETLHLQGSRPSFAGVETQDRAN